MWCHLIAADCCPHWAANSTPESQGLVSLDAKLTSNIERGEASDEALPANIDRPTPYPMNIDRCATELSIDLCVLHQQGLALSARGISQKTQGNMGCRAHNGTGGALVGAQAKLVSQSCLAEIASSRGLFWWHGRTICLLLAAAASFFVGSTGQHRQGRAVAMGGSIADLLTWTAWA